MTELSALWLPILLAAVFVFIASSIIHMGPLWHRRDNPGFPDEERARAALGSLNVPPGDYMVPRCYGMKEMQSAEFLAKMNQGPVWVVTVLPNGPTKMGGSLVGWFLFTVLVSLITAYIASNALAPGANYLDVMQIAGCTAFAAYSLGQVPNSIWFKRQWSVTFKHVLDGLIYGLLTGGTFGWLWPRVAG